MTVYTKPVVDTDLLFLSVRLIGVTKRRGIKLGTRTQRLNQEQFIQHLNSNLSQCDLESTENSVKSISKCLKNAADQAVPSKTVKFKGPKKPVSGEVLSCSKTNSPTVATPSLPLRYCLPGGLTKTEGNTTARSLARRQLKNHIRNGIVQANRDQDNYLLKIKWPSGRYAISNV